MKSRNVISAGIFVFTLIWITNQQISADGGYFSTSQSVAISADQRVIIVKNGNEISMTFSTGYTGDGEDFGWVIPTPVPPDVEDVCEAGKQGEAAFQFLEENTAPEFRIISEGGGGGSGGTGSCFPAGTEVLTFDGPRAIEDVDSGAMVYTCDLANGEWVLKRVLKTLSHHYDGDMIHIQIGGIGIQATSNHPFYVLDGERLASRPLPLEVPSEAMGNAIQGRWVEAGNLKVGDVLKSKCEERVVVTEVSGQYARTEVYNLCVEDHHNYAVHQNGILVHNKGRQEMATGAAMELRPRVTVYGTATFEHYEVSILRAAAASDLLDWFQKNDYQVDPAAREILAAYIDQNWAFVAVKLNPSERRRYNNEFLPPLTIMYQSDQCIFPLRISSVSSTKTVKISLYVIDRSTVSSSNFPTANLKHEDIQHEALDPELYIETCIEETIGSGGNGLAVIWGQPCGENAIMKYSRGTRRITMASHPLARDIGEKIFGLMKTPFQEGKAIFLTRLEARMNRHAMTDDIELVPDQYPNYFLVYIRTKGGLYSAITKAAENGDLTTVQELLRKGANVNARSLEPPGSSALIYAAGRGHVDVVKTLLDAGADVNLVDDEGLTALVSAARYGHMGVVEVLLDRGANAYEQALAAAAGEGYIEIVRFLIASRQYDDSDRTGFGDALASAAGNGQSETVRFLLDAGAEVNSRGTNGFTPLMRAASNGHTDIVNILLNAGADVNASSEDFYTALIVAGWSGRADMMKLLLDAGADVNLTDKNGKTALLRAPRYGNSEEVAGILIDAGADVNARGKDGGTALMDAAGRGLSEVVKRLADAGAELNLKNGEGKTALIIAGWRGQSRVVKILLDAGADINAIDKDGYTALMRAADRGKDETARILLKAEEDTRSAYGRTTLMTAAQRGDAKIVSLLLEAGARVDLNDNLGFTALMWAAAGGHREVVALILEAGANINSKRGNGWTALMQAVWRGNEETVRILLDAEADVHAVDDSGWTALMIAKEKGNSAIADMLREAGAE